MFEKIGNIAIDKVGEMIIDTARNLLFEYKEKKQWSKLFIDTNEFLLKEVEYGDELLNEIAEYLSGDDMMQLAQNLTKDSKYDLIEKRYKRFCYEIKKQQEAATKINGILPIKDFDFPDCFSKNSISGTP